MPPSWRPRVNNMLERSRAIKELFESLEALSENHSDDTVLWAQATLLSWADVYVRALQIVELTRIEGDDTGYGSGV